MKLRNGAHTDRAIDASPGSTLAIAQDNASTPFLRLPTEVKNLIYHYAFGGNLIHIVNIAESPDKADAKFRNTICRAEISEEEAQRNFDEESESDWRVPANEGRHERCRYPQTATSSVGEEQRPEMLSLDALRSCRQMYNEAHYIPYSANTFACADSRTLRSFILSLAKGGHKNHLALRSLFLEVVTARNLRTKTCWGEALQTCARKCKNVENVNINLDLRSWFWMRWIGSPADFEARGPNWKTRFMSDLFVLKKLPLKSATFVIDDNLVGRDDDLITTLLNLMRDPAHWTLEEKRAWAHYVRELILR